MNPLHLVRALRPHQWVKNGLVFLPMLMGHRLMDVSVWLDASLAFFALSLCASGTYVLNDLVDREADRLHPTKRHRPFASGALAPEVGYVLAPALVAAGFALAVWQLPATFAAVLGLYLLTTVAYSYALKRLPIVDVLVLAGLYALRVFAGGAATGIPISQWLLSFSLFFFLALLSINLAIINLFPIPILDGGHLLFLLIEAVKGSPVSERTFGYSQVVGLVMIMSLMVYVTYQDIVRWFIDRP